MLTNRILICYHIAIMNKKNPFFVQARKRHVIIEIRVIMVNYTLKSDNRQGFFLIARNS